MGRWDLDIGAKTLFSLLLTIGFVFLFSFLKLYWRRAYYDPAGLLVISASCESVASSTFENKVGDQHGIPHQNTGKKSCL